MNAFYFTQRATARFFAVVAMFSLIGGMLPNQAFATHNPDAKVNICKANQSDAGFVAGVKNVSENAVNTGIGDSGINIDIVENAQNWTTVYGGFTGAQIFNNGCVIPTDLCPNIAGGQITLPDGKVLVGGQCVDIPPPPPPLPCPSGTTGVSVPNCVPIPPPTPTCHDGIRNQDETGVDVGGVCGAGTPAVNGCTNSAATNYNADATPGNPDAEKCDVNYVSQCGANPNLLANASFESNVGLTSGRWGIFNPISGWAATAGGLEIWNHLLTAPSNGDQNAELDGNSPTTISQTVATIPGATYELRFDFAARANTGGASNNSVKATADGNTVVTQSTGNTNWTTYGGIFVADASTDVAIADLGTADSLGTLVDNAVLCLVKKPVVDVCPNIDGTQTADDGYSKDVNGKCYRPIDSCSLSVVSDTTNTVNDSNALLVTPHPVWVASITDSLAKWIWGSAVDTPIDPVNDETQTFTKTFVWSGTPSTALLTLAADNAYSVKLNGTTVGGNAGEYNYSSAATITDITDNLITGVNTLEISVTNKANGATSLNIENGNPAGLLYDLKITNTTGDCAPGGGGDNVQDTYKIQGYVWHDDNVNQIWDSIFVPEQETTVKTEDPLAGWTVHITNGVTTLTTTTDANGFYYFDVPAGTWTITEDVQTNWFQTNQTSYVVTVPAVPVVSFLDSVVNAIIPTAYAAVVGSPYGDYNFGNDDRTGGGGGGGTGGHGGGGGSTNKPTPPGEVLGASDSKPQGEVLGAQVSNVPAGAPNAGAGGAAPFNFGFVSVAPVAFLRRNRIHG